MTNYTSITFDLRDRVAVITLNRPDKANGINLALATELVQAAKAVDNNPDIKAVVLTGSGRFFSAGGDIKDMAAYGDDVGRGIKALADNLHMATSTFARMDAPVIMAVNGLAAGAGFSLAISGDIVIASDAAGFIMAYTNSGLSPDGGSTYYLPRLIGLRRTQELMLRNRKLSAEDAMEWGLVTEVVSAGDLMGRAMDIASEFASGSKGAHAGVKKLLLTSFNNSLETQMELEGREISARASASDGREGITAFVAKRKPEFG